MLAGGVAGCSKSASVQGKPIPAGQVARITAGQTTEVEIRQWFGEPLDVVMTNTGKVLTYRHQTASGAGLSIPFLRIGGGTTRGQLLIVTLDHEGRVVRHTFIGGP